MPLAYVHNFIKKFRTSPAKKNKIIIIVNIIALLINLATWIFLYLKLKQIVDLRETKIIPLHYNVQLGIDLHGNWLRAFIMPTWGLVILIINYFLSLWVYHSKNIISYFLTITTLLVQIIIFAAMIFTLLLNI